MSEYLNYPTLFIVRLFIFIWQYIVTNYFSMKPTDALVSKFILVQNSTCFGQFLYPSSGVSYVHSALAYLHAGLTTASCRQTCVTCVKWSLGRCTRPVVIREKGGPRKRWEKFWNQNLVLPKTCNGGRAIIQANSCRTLVAEAWVRCPVSPCRVGVGQGGSGTVLTTRDSFLPYRYHSNNTT
jgi:hypothetical protein